MPDRGATIQPSIKTALLVDVETTGLNPSIDEIVELGMVLFDFSLHTGDGVSIRDEYVGLREPGVSVSRGAMAVHGITPDSLQGRKLNSSRVNSLLQSADVIIAHNARFDYAFLTRLFPLAAERAWRCTLRQVDWGRVPSRRLTELLTIHGISVAQTHRAGADCHALLALLQEIGSHGRSYLWELTHGAPSNSSCPPAMQDR